MACSLFRIQRRISSSGRYFPLGLALPPEPTHEPFYSPTPLHCCCLPRVWAPLLPFPIAAASVVESSTAAKPAVFRRRCFSRCRAPLLLHHNRTILPELCRQSMPQSATPQELQPLLPGEGGSIRCRARRREEIKERWRCSSCPVVLDWENLESEEKRN